MTKNHVSVRLTAETLARVDALIPQLHIDGRAATRSDVLRRLVLSALDRPEPAPRAATPEEHDR